MKDRLCVKSISFSKNQNSLKIHNWWDPMWSMLCARHAEALGLQASSVSAGRWTAADLVTESICLSFSAKSTEELSQTWTWITEHGARICTRFNSLWLDEDFYVDIHKEYWSWCCLMEMSLEPGQCCLLEWAGRCFLFCCMEEFLRIGFF